MKPAGRSEFGLPMVEGVLCPFPIDGVVVRTVAATCVVCLSLMATGCGSSPLVPVDPPAVNPVNRGDGSNVDPSSASFNASVDSMLPFEGAARARIRNESDSDAKITLRFLKDGSTAQLAYVEVPTRTITTVASPHPVDRLELSGVNEDRALEPASFVFGVDFDQTTPAEYIIRSGRSPVSEFLPDDVQALDIVLLEPSSDIVVTLGSTFRARWADEGTRDSTVRLFLQSTDATAAAREIPVSPTVTAAVDGLNDEIIIIAQNLAPGVYELIARIARDDDEVRAVAAGRITIVEDAENVPPRVQIRKPVAEVTLRASDGLLVAWDDQDPDDVAILQFSLERADSAGPSVGRFSIGPSIAEDPDGGADEETLVLDGVLPGLYDLVATIKDARSVGTDRLARAVRVLPKIDNDPPRLQMDEPSRDITVPAGGTLLVRWRDGDDNDDARVSLLLDSDWSDVQLSGNESLLSEALSENDPADERHVTIPSDTPAGTYRLVGMIADGMTQVVTRAPGLVIVTARSDGADNDSTLSNPIDDNPDKTNGGGEDDPEKDDSGKDGGGKDDSADDAGTDDSGDDSGTDDGNGGTIGDEPDDGNNGDGPGGDKNTNPDDGPRTTDPNPNKRGGGSGKAGSPDKSGGLDTIDIDKIGRPDKDAGDTVDPDGGKGKGDDGGGDGNNPGDGNNGDQSGGGRDGNIPVRVFGRADSDRLRQTTWNTGLESQRDGDPVRLIASNRSYGGETEVVVEAGIGSAAPTVSELIRRIPNDAWPRSFDVVTDVVVGSEVVSIRSPEPLWVPQRVEIVSLQGRGLECSSNALASAVSMAPVRTVEVSWYGGGIAENAVTMGVEFWLSKDDSIPFDGEDDGTHLMLARFEGSPNSVRSTRLFLPFAAGDQPMAESNDSPPRRASIEAGLYRLILAIEDYETGEFSVLAASSADVCLR